jgi:hypothetical protein
MYYRKFPLSEDLTAEAQIMIMIIPNLYDTL